MRVKRGKTDYKKRAAMLQLFYYVFRMILISYSFCVAPHVPSWQHAEF